MLFCSRTLLASSVVWPLLGGFETNSAPVSLEVGREYFEKLTATRGRLRLVCRASWRLTLLLGFGCAWNCDSNTSTWSLVRRGRVEGSAPSSYSSIIDAWCAKSAKSLCECSRKYLSRCCG